MAVDFSNIEKLNCSDKVVDFKFKYILPDAVLHVRPFSSTCNVELRKTAMALSDEKGLTISDIMQEFDSKNKKHRDAIADLLVGIVVVGWENVQDAKGKKVSFNETNARAFIQALPEFAIEEIVLFCVDLSHFIKNEVNIEQVAKN